jgi:toxin YoeB
MEIKYSSRAQEDIKYWKASGNKGIMNRITALLKDMEAHPFTGTGKPEVLKYDFAGCWSRRINAAHRIIYAVHEAENYIYVLALRYHYTKK